MGVVLSTVDICILKIQYSLEKNFYYIKKSPHFTGIFRLSQCRLNTFDNSRDTLTKTDTHRRKTDLRILLFHHV
ncbi:hypothetical protein F934_00130 [Acinetobacter beijerinckii ANC 3835]|uniref:Uncharacterized protein n=1 Tax=Acinetobacter beijerinckii ANC 3835 TaxID=1217649 RepID=N9EDQ8_9GAMM|nr:hypothetical protein F934_00130 [Acinetobacter beijerinckii ANC 3835]